MTRPAPISPKIRGAIISEAQRLVGEAHTYQKFMEAGGTPLTFAQAVRAVSEGKAG